MFSQGWLHQGNAGAIAETKNLAYRDVFTAGLRNMYRYLDYNALALK